MVISTTCGCDTGGIALGDGFLEVLRHHCLEHLLANPLGKARADQRLRNLAGTEARDARLLLVRLYVERIARETSSSGIVTSTERVTSGLKTGPCWCV